MAILLFCILTPCKYADANVLDKHTIPIFRVLLVLFDLKAHFSVHKKENQLVATLVDTIRICIPCFLIIYLDIAVERKRETRQYIALHL
jgi:hypothetical protein